MAEKARDMPQSAHPSHDVGGSPTTARGRPAATASGDHTTLATSTATATTATMPAVHLADRIRSSLMGSPGKPAAAAHGSESFAAGGSAGTPQAMRGDGTAELRARVRKEALRAPMDLCLDTYRVAGRDPHDPVVFAGSLSARWCAVGRELGREEVELGEPLVGMAGRRFRRAFHEAVLGPADPGERRFDAVLPHVLLTNLVPYRPVGNRAYDRTTRERFRPFLERLLADHWTGDRVLALGQHALAWFEPYAPDGAVRELWADADTRFSRWIDVRIGCRDVRLAVVPHPSPLSPFKGEFAAILARRLAE